MFNRNPNLGRQFPDLDLSLDAGGGAPSGPPSKAHRGEPVSIAGGSFVAHEEPQRLGATDKSIAKGEWTSMSMQTQLPAEAIWHPDPPEEAEGNDLTHFKVLSEDPAQQIQVVEGGRKYGFNAGPGEVDVSEPDRFMNGKPTGWALSGPKTSVVPLSGLGAELRRRLGGE